MSAFTREEDTHRRKGEPKTLDYHDEVRDVDERLHEVLTTLDFHDFRRTGAKTNISSDLVNQNCPRENEGPPHSPRCGNPQATHSTSPQLMQTVHYSKKAAPKITLVKTQTQGPESGANAPDWETPRDHTDQVGKPSVIHIPRPH